MKNVLSEGKLGSRMNAVKEQINELEDPVDELAQEVFRRNKSSEEKREKLRIGIPGGVLEEERDKWGEGSNLPELNCGWANRRDLQGPRFLGCHHETLIPVAGQAIVGFLNIFQHDHLLLGIYKKQVVFDLPIPPGLVPNYRVIVFSTEAECTMCS